MLNGTFFTEPKDFLDLALDPRNIVHSILPLGPVPEEVEMLYVSHTLEEEFVDVLPNTNVVLAAFTTSTARLKLYSYLEKLQERVLYFDTDSIVYVSRPQDTYEPPIGCFLGDLTNELEEYGLGAYIDEFIGAGPKNYSMRIRKPDGTTETKIKIRGFTSSYQQAAHLNRKTLKRKVFEFLRDGVSAPTTVVRPKIERRPNREVVTVTRKKDYRIVYDKRRVMKDGSTLPFGYCSL